ncbi:MAG: hypothetical protein Tsb0010_02330 [Parvularculaceae bacterium]
MPYEIFPEKRGLLIVYSGDVSLDELLRSTAECWAHPDWENHHYHICDWSAATSLAITEEHTELSAGIDRVAFTEGRKFKCAMVNKTPEMIALSESYIAKSQSENFEARVFANVEDARAWVDG